MECCLSGSIVFSSVSANVERSETGIYEMPNLFLCGFEIGMILVIFHMCSMMLVS